MRRPLRPPRIDCAKVVRVDLDEGLRPLEVEDRYPRVLLVVMSRGSVLGQVLVRAEPVLNVERQWDAITGELEEVLWRERLRTAFARAARGSSEQRRVDSGPSVSLVVCTRDRPHDLRSCLDSVSLLRTPPHEVIVVDNCPNDQATSRLCRGYPVRYVVEPAPGTSRAKNRGIVEASGEVVAFVDDDCVVDPHWLDGLRDPFDDRLVMALIGYAGPLELETRAQYLFEAHGGFQRYPEERRFDGAASSPVAISGTAGPGANSLFRRRAFEEVGLFDEDLGPGTPARGAEDKDLLYRIAESGYRVVFDPARIVWHRHRRDRAALRRTLFGYTTGEFAYTTRCLLNHRELTVLRAWSWWLRHLAGDLRRLARGDDLAVPLDLILAEATGIPLGYWNLKRSRRRRRGISPVERSGARPRPDVQRRAAHVRGIDAEPPALSVVIASRNRRERLRQVLGGLANQRYPSDRFETVVVLDGTTDGSGELVRSLELPYRVEVLEQEHKGLAASRNRGARAATHPIVVYLDDDILPTPEFLEEHARAHQRVDDHVALGYYPPVLEQPTLWGYAVRAWWEDHFRRKAEPGHQWTYIDFSDGNSSMPAPLLFNCGGYDEDFKGRRQDWELGIRLLRHGAAFAYYPGARGDHYLDTRFVTALRQARQEGSDDVLLGCKHPHVRGHLPLAGEAGPGPRAPRRLLLAYRPAAAEHLLRSGSAALDGLERLRLRYHWRRLAHVLLRLSYVQGVADALPTLERLEEFLAPVWTGDSVASLPVWLDTAAQIDVPPGAGALELNLGYAGVPLVRARAIDVASQWDWAEVTERAVRAASQPIRRAILLQEQLARGLAGDGSPRTALGDSPPDASSRSDQAAVEEGDSGPGRVGGPRIPDPDALP
jgi:GT2 family glycosyltransferase